MAEPQQSVSDLLKKFGHGNKSQAQPAPTKPVIQPNPEKTTTSNNIASTASKQPTTVASNTSASTQPSQTQTPPVIQKPKIEPEIIPKPAVPSNPVSNQNQFTAQIRPEPKVNPPVQENNKPATETPAQVLNEAKRTIEEAKPSPFGNTKPAFPVNNQSSSGRPAEPEKAPTTSNPSPFGAKVNTQPKVSTPRSENASTPSSNVEVSAQPKASPFGGVKLPGATPVLPSNNQSVSSNKNNEEEKSASKPVNVFGAKPAEVKPVVKEQVPVQNKVNEASSNQSQPAGLSIKDRMKMFEKNNKNEENASKPVISTSSKPVVANPVKESPKAVNSVKVEAPVQAKMVVKEELTKKEPEVVKKEVSNPVVKNIFKEEAKKPEVIKPLEAAVKQEVTKPVVGSSGQSTPREEKKPVETSSGKVERKESGGKLTEFPVVKKEEAKKPAESSNGKVERKESGGDKAPAPVIGGKKDFAANLNALLGGKVSTAEPIKVVKPKTDEPAQDTYTEALLAKPAVVASKKKATIKFDDDDEEF